MVSSLERALAARADAVDVVDAVSNSGDFFNRQDAKSAKEFSKNRSDVESSAVNTSWKMVFFLHLGGLGVLAFLSKQQALGIGLRRSGALFRPQGIDVGDEGDGGFFLAAEDVGEAGFPGIGGAAEVLGEALGGLG
jgi:hypothetical protein